MVETISTQWTDVIMTPLNKRIASMKDLLALPPEARLFVYGTLMTTAEGAFGQAARSRLGWDQPDRLTATVRGHIYELGKYPGLVPAEGTDVVHGQLMRLADPLRTLSWLDEYEEISTAPGADNEYARDLLDVTVDGGPTLSAWVYPTFQRHSALAKVANKPPLAKLAAAHLIAF
jgi:gamma-glutamylcyclotransferase (GGCT)/AIG2-like uncharacterized protein YtfP